MNVLNNNSDDGVECPLCMEPLEADDLNFYPCTCGYQICRFCWHRIRTDENELCPACRKAYPENPADFTPLSQEQIAALKAEKRQRDQQRKQKITENRKHLANVRVVQKNLVFVVGLPPRLADPDILKKHEYFGKYGKIHKVVINPSTAYAGIQGPSASAYVTYVHNNDALRAIQSVNNIVIDGRLIKTSLGTTKYCSHFMKNQQCPKGDCMYLHELGDPEASFTKEEMHQGKHQEYEKRLHDALIASSNGSVTTQNSKNGDNKLGNGTGSVQTTKEAWPSLSISPVNMKESQSQQQQTTGKSKGKDGGNRKHDKSRGDKKGKNQKNRNENSSNNNKDNKENGNSGSNNATTNGIANHQNGTKDSSQTNDSRTLLPAAIVASDKQSKQNHQTKRLSADEEVNLIDDLDKDTSSEDNDTKNGDTRSLSSSSSHSSSNGDSSSLTGSSSGKSSPGSFPDHPLSTTPESQPTTISSPTSDTQGSSTSENSSMQQSSRTDTNSSKSEVNVTSMITGDVTNIIDTSACLSKLSLFDDNNSFFSTSTFEQLFKDKLDNDNRTAINNQINSTITSQLPDLLNGIDGYQNHNNMSSSSILGGLNGLGGLGSLVSSSSTISSSNQSSNSSSINSPSTTTTSTSNPLSISNFIDNPDKYLLSSLNATEEWEQAFKYLMMRNNKQMEDQQQQEEFLRLQELQKRNLINSMGMSQQQQQQQQQQPQQPPYLHDFNVDFLHNGTDMNRLSQSHLFQQQQQQQQQQSRQPNGLHQTDHSNMFGTNMSKFFDFHKNQQQQLQQQQYLMNGYNNSNMVNDHRDHLSMAALLENRINSQHMDHNNGLIGQQLQKQRMLSKFDQIGTHNSQNMLMNPNSSNMQQPQQQNRIHNQFMHNSPVDDDLGFDPFFETQKALAELMENEQSQNNHNKHLLENCQRARMPPPGFNHMNAFGFGVPRAQGSKILPFMNSSQQQQQQQIPQQQNNWPHHMAGFPQQPQQQPQQQQQNSGGEQQMHMGQPNQNLNKTGGYGSMSDWTAMDPAILSFRQFPSYSLPQQHGPDMFMQHLNQQSGQGFGHHGQNLMNQQQQPQQQQQQSPAQVNYSHSNWFNNSAEQNMFMNSLGGNGGYSNNYEKFLLPPGIHINNMNNCISSNKQQKTECIN